MEMVCEDCGMYQTHGNLNEIRKGQKDSNGFTKCWPGKHAEGTKTGKNGGQVRNCVPNESINESADEEAWELVGQPVPEIQQFVKQLGLSNDQTSVAKIAPLINATPDTQIPAASIPQLKNLANKGNDAQTLKAIQQISGRPDAAEQYARLMQARDAGEGRNRGYPVGGLIQAVKSGNYEAPVLLKLPTGVYVIGGRTRLYAALALGVPAKVKVINANTFAKQGQQGVAEGHADQQRKVFKKNGEPVGEVGIDRESSPGVGQYYMKHYASGKDLAGYDSYEEAVAELKHCMKQGVAEDQELVEEFDLIESIIEDLAASNGVDSEVIWEDLESLDDDELYVFATTSTIMETISESRGGNYEQMGYRKSDKDKFVLLDRTLDSVILTTNNFAEAKKEAIEWAEYDDIRAEVIQQDTGKRVFTVDGYAGAEKYLDESEAWQKANNRDKTDGMSRKAVKTYRREHPGSKLQTAVTTKPSKLKKGSKASKRRKSYCSRSKGQMKMHNISCAKTPDKAICKARRRWNC
jgi:hypothetical protein